MLVKRMRAFCVVATTVIISIAVASCMTPPEIQVDPPPPTPVVTPVEKIPEPVAVNAEPVPVAQVPFDPATVSVELKQTTFVNVQELILSLNSIIQSKDFEGWSKVLTQDYLQYYSSPETLARLSESAVLKRQSVTLKSLADYFNYVVYPSRQNDRVDDIEFIEPAKIKAIIINPKGERLVLYNLEKIGDTWKIAIWR